MNSEVNPAFVKSLYRALVKVFGGVYAAGQHLGLSHQYVSRLGSANPEHVGDQPDYYLHILPLELESRSPIVSEGIAHAIRGLGGGRDMLKESCEVSEAALEVQRLARTGAPQKDMQNAIARLHREVADLPAAANQS